MKLVALNVWGGTVYAPLIDYLKKLSANTDIFCFQEVFSAMPGAPQVSSGARMFLFEEFAELLPEFSGFFDLRSEGYDFNGPINAPVSHGLAVFLRTNLIKVKTCNSKLLGTGEEDTDLLVKAQVLNLASGGKNFSVINFHGAAQPGNKLDTPQRLDHAAKLRLLWESLGENAKILCGDFNLYPETKSIKILEAGARNLIEEFKIENTRNRLSWCKHGNCRQTFADFTFVSPELQIRSFEVPYNEISDHLPMILEFDL